MLAKDEAEMNAMIFLSLDLDLYSEKGLLL